MSLYNLARQVQSKGRGDDTMLVHMTPGEVQGLQALAMKHGGSLSINPDTGLPEAGFLGRILPSVVGGVVGIATMNPMLGAAVGGGLGLATSKGNLGRGIMSGLGAWGLGSIGAGLAATGAVGAESASVLGDAALAAGDTTAGMVGAANTGLPVGTQTLGGTVTAGGAGGGAGAASSLADPWKNLGTGFNKTTFDANWLKQNAFPVGAAALGTMSALEGGAQNQPITVDKGQIRPYTYSQTRNPDFGFVPGAPYFNQTYTAGTPYAAATGGLVALAEGGKSEEKIKLADFPYQPKNIEMAKLAPAVTKYGATREVPASVQAYNDLLAARAANEYLAQPAPLPMLPGGGERATPEDTRKIINEMYLSQLGRQGDQGGLDYWAGQKAQTGMSLADVKKQIGGSQEGQIFGLYRDVLGRRPDEAGAAYWQSQLEAGVPLADIRKQFETSKEKKASQPTYFDPEYYAKANPDIARISEYRTDPFLHYQRHGFQEGRAGAEGYTGKDMLSLAPKAAPAGQTGFKYDPTTGRFSGGLPQPQQQDFSGFMNFANDPNFQAYLQNQYNQFQQAQSGGGGKAGGLMPNALKLNMGGGISDLGSYSDGGRLLKGPGDGVSDSIPAQIGNRQPARLADGEFVVPARIVSELGNGSTDAGARKLYAMMDRVQKKRGKTVGKGKVAVNSKADRVLPA